jgi:citrate lyase subunit beta / citryl-CoA lyase
MSSNVPRDVSRTDAGDQSMIDAPGRATLYGPAILFCPGDRPDRFDKALRAADQVILDLEDAVAADDKPKARHEVASALPDLDPARVIVRINPLGTAGGREDLESLAGTGVRHLMAPKSEPTGTAFPAGYTWIALCETPAGVLGAQELAATAGVGAVTWGSEDLAAALGARVTSGVDQLMLPHLVLTRGIVPLAAAAAGISALDRVFLDLDDDAGLRAEATEAVAMGYGAKLAIHPRQVPVIRDAFLPSDEEVEEARAVLAAAEEVGGRAFAYRGKMVDEPLLAQARIVVALAEDAERT